MQNGSRVQVLRHRMSTLPWGISGGNVGIEGDSAEDSESQGHS